MRDMWPQQQVLDLSHHPAVDRCRAPLRLLFALSIDKTHAKRCGVAPALALRFDKLRLGSCMLSQGTHPPHCRLLT